MLASTMFNYAALAMFVLLVLAIGVPRLRHLWFRFSLFRRCGFTRTYSVLRAMHVPCHRLSPAWRFTRLPTGLALLLVASACAAPTAPAPAAPRVTTGSPAIPVPVTHNIPATMETGEGGMDIIVWVCATQPRIYCGTDGACKPEVDHYISRTQCPRIPIQ